MDGAVNSADAVEALEAYKELYKCCTPPGYSDAYMQEGLDAFKSGQVAMMMNWFAFWPGMYKDENVGGDKIGFFVNPGEKTAASTLGGQGISVVSYSDKQDEALQYIKWFAQPEVQKKWAALGGYSTSKAVLDDPASGHRRPSRADFLVAMGQVQDFWQEPAFAELMQSMQKRVHDYVVADQGTAQGSARQADRGLDGDLPGRGQDLDGANAIRTMLALLRQPLELTARSRRMSGLARQSIPLDAAVSPVTEWMPRSAMACRRDCQPIPVSPTGG